MPSSRIALDRHAVPSYGFALFLAAQTALLLVLLFLHGPLLFLAAGAVALVVLLCAPIPVAITVFVLAGAFFPFTEYRFRVALSGLAVLFALIFLGDRLRLALDGRVSAEATPLRTPIAVFMVIVAFASIVGIAGGATITQWPLEAFPYACLALAPIIARRLTARSLSRVFFAYSLFLVIQSVHAVALFVQGGFIRLQSASFSVHPGLAAVVLLSLAVMHEERKWRRWATVALFAMILQLASTMTRGYWTGFLAGAVVVYLVAWRSIPARAFRRLLAATAGTIAFLTVAVYSLLVHWGLIEALDVLGKRVGTFSNLQVDASTRVRMAEWGVAWKHFLESPVIGNGLGFRLSFLDPIFLTRGTHNWFVHNSYLLLLVKTGIVGLLGFLAVVVAYLRLAAGTLRTTRGSSRAFVAGFLGNMVQLLAMAATNYTFDSPVNMPYVAFLIGGTIAIAREASKRGSLESPRP